MKIKHLVATIVLTGVFVVGVLNVYHQSQKEQMSDTALANIEALAGDDTTTEGGTDREIACYPSIKIDPESIVTFCGDCQIYEGYTDSFWSLQSTCQR